MEECCPFCKRGMGVEQVVEGWRRRPKGIRLHAWYYGWEGEFGEFAETPEWAVDVGKGGVN